MNYQREIFWTAYLWIPEGWLCCFQKIAFYSHKQSLWWRVHQEKFTKETLISSRFNKPLLFVSHSFKSRYQYIPETIILYLCSRLLSIVSHNIHWIKRPHLFWVVKQRSLFFTTSAGRSLLWYPSDNLGTNLPWFLNLTSSRLNYFSHVGGLGSTDVTSADGSLASAWQAVKFNEWSVFTRIFLVTY